ncbi:hypothetical protein BH10PSE1_BH10PSE1_31330 [soil metagenome]
MRKALTSFAAVMAVLALSACGDPKPAETDPQTSAADTAAVEQSTVMPEDAPPQEEADEAPAATAAEESGAACSAELGAASSARLVERCIAVSPATHPPCNAQNPCALIRDEIDRSCAMYGPGEDKPAECAG